MPTFEQLTGIKYEEFVMCSDAYQQALRDQCKYYTENREGGIKQEITSNFYTEFLENCRKSKCVFLPDVYFDHILFADEVINFFDVIDPAKATQIGCPGSIFGCWVYSEHSLHERHRDLINPEIIFVPR